MKTIAIPQSFEARCHTDAEFREHIGYNLFKDSSPLRPAACPRAWALLDEDCREAFRNSAAEQVIAFQSLPPKARDDANRRALARTLERNAEQMDAK